MGETVKLKDIAARQDISEKYMEQIVAVLNKAGYVRSTRGFAQGGLSAGETAAAVHGWYDTETDRRLSRPVDCLSDNALPCERNGNVLL